MKVNFFKPEDFADGRPDWSPHAAAMANAKLEREGLRVYLHKSTVTDGWIWHVLHKNFGYSSHTAILINIEELPKKPCEHEPARFSTSMRFTSDFKNVETSYLCKHCGVSLKAKWEACE